MKTIWAHFLAVLMIGCSAPAPPPLHIRPYTEDETEVKLAVLEHTIGHIFSGSTDLCYVSLQPNQIEELRSRLPASTIKPISEARFRGRLLLPDKASGKLGVVLGVFRIKVTGRTATAAAKYGIGHLTTYEFTLSKNDVWRVESAEFSSVE
jgi:hypothetical protein